MARTIILGMLDPMGNKYVQIHPSMDKLIIALRTAYAKGGTLDKEATSHNLLDRCCELIIHPFIVRNLTAVKCVNFLQ